MSSIALLNMTLERFLTGLDVGAACRPRDVHSPLRALHAMLMGYAAER